MTSNKLRFLLLSALLLTGCASASNHLSDLSPRHSFRQPLIQTPGSQETSRPDPRQLLAHEIGFDTLESPPTRQTAKSGRYLAQSAVTEYNHEPMSVLPDSLPLGFYQFKTDSFTLVQQDKKADEFDLFNKEFDDVKLDTERKEIIDPLIGYNRVIFHFNDKLYYWILKPLAQGYGWVIPEKGRIAIDRFFKNLSFPVRFVNNALQGKFKRAGIETARFALNTTIGLLGFFDPADNWYDLKAYPEDFGQTLGHYHVGDGAPFDLPFLGPSNIRDAVGLIPDIYIYPVRFLYEGEKYVINPVFLGIFILETINRTSLQIGVYESLTQYALDPYTMLRDAYKQNRDARIKE